MTIHSTHVDKRRQTQKFPYGFLLGVALLLLATTGLLHPVSGAEALDLAPFLEIQGRYEDNPFQVSPEAKPQANFVTNLWTGLEFKTHFDENTQIRVRYEAAPRWFSSSTEGNRQDHLLSFLLRRRLPHNLSLLTVANVGLRSQPRDPIQEYLKGDLTGQLHIPWNQRWSSQLGLQIRAKSFPNNKRVNYTSLMLEAKLRRRLSMVSSAGVGYQARVYQGAIDPRVLVSELNRDMQGVRQSADVWFDSLLLDRLLTRWEYRFEVDRATRELQRHENFALEPEQTGDFGGNYQDEDEDADFNFSTHRLSGMLIGQLSDRATLSFSLRYHHKRYRDWFMPITQARRSDDLISFRIAWRQKLSSHLSTRLEYALEKNRSNDPNQRYADNSYSAQLQIHF